MTVKTNYLAGHSYDPADLVAQFAGMFSNGVLTGGAVTEHSPANLSVDVAAVKTMCAGLFLNSDAVENISITANTSGYSRIDVIAADLDNESIVAVQGTPSSSPTAPVLTGNKIALAQVLVGNNVSVINTANITDVRVYSMSVNLTKADTAHAASLINSWAVYNSGTYGPVTFKKNAIGDIVLSGYLQGGNTATVAFYLPVGSRPPYSKNYDVICSVADHVARILVGADGAVEINYPNGATWVSLDGIAIPTV